RRASVVDGAGDACARTDPFEAGVAGGDACREALPLFEVLLFELLLRDVPLAGCATPTTGVAELEACPASPPPRPSDSCRATTAVGFAGSATRSRPPSPSSVCARASTLAEVARGTTTTCVVCAWTACDDCPRSSCESSPRSSSVEACTSSTLA